MILSNKDIIKYRDDGKIKITPFDQNELGTASYKFKLGVNLLQPSGNDLIDFKKGLVPEYKEISLTNEGYKLDPEEFILAQTHELLTLSSQIVMIIEGKSSLARCGIEVVQTSTFIEADHKDSIITLEIKNNGKSPFMLYPQMSFAKGVFHILSSEADLELSKSSYTTQTEVEPPKGKNYFKSNLY